MVSGFRVIRKGKVEGGVIPMANKEKNGKSGRENH